jgi:hypothetical protein
MVGTTPWLQGYLEENPLISKEDSDLQDLCRQFYTAAVAPALPANEKAPPAPVQPPAAHEETKQISAK